MIPRVYILVYCRNPELWKASTLVFQTIRKGFPENELFIRGNNLNVAQADEIAWISRRVGGHFINGDLVPHWQWIENLIQEQDMQFVICDTDVIFRGDLSEYVFPAALAGRLVPRFRCPMTNCVTHERLHPSLMWINPAGFRAWAGNIDRPLGIGMELVRPLIYPVLGELFLHDTLGAAYHAMGGWVFHEGILDRYDHLNAGTYLDLLDEKIPGSRARQEQMIDHPELARGIWKQQQKWYDAHAA